MGVGYIWEPEPKQWCGSFFSDQRESPVSNTMPRMGRADWVATMRQVTILCTEYLTGMRHEKSDYSGGLLTRCESTRRIALSAGGTKGIPSKAGGRGDVFLNRCETGNTNAASLSATTMIANQPQRTP